ncbi:MULTISPECIES: prepilin peptidase [Aphanothece]|uniref:prepilin peptidase n=1 Tax=Aphanothece TaxID=1121 RepID=UPI003984A2A5
MAPDPLLLMVPRPSPFWLWLACLLGACIGSLLNVVAWRLPREESLVRPPSHCPHCGTRLRWHDNIPVLGWLLLRGRCRHCGAAISWRYPLVELLTAGLWVAALLATPSAMGPDPLPWTLVAAGWLLLSWLIPLTLIDLDRLWLPEPLCRNGLLLGLGCTALIGFAQGEGVGRDLLFHHLAAAGVGLLGFESVSAIAEKLAGRPALGLGDAKLAALLGAWLGLTGLGLTVALAVLGGAAVGIVGRLSGRLGPLQPLPFGPFLTAGGAAVWLLGHDFWLHQLGLAF